MPALVETMFSAREVPWHKIGTVTPDVLTAEEALKAGGLDWEVELKPVYAGIGGEKVLVDGQHAVVRDSDNSVLGIVGKNYVPFQNREAFTFFDNLVDSGEAKYETAGSLRDGKWVWLMAEVPTEVAIGGIDDHKFYILLSTSHDGTKSIQVDVTPVRVVCANTLNMAWRGSKKRWSARHLSTAGQRIAEARETIGLTFRYMERFQDEANALIEQSFNNQQMSVMLNKLLPDLPRTPQVKATIMENFVEGPTLENIRGTKWGALNAIGEYYDWLRNPRTPQSQVLGSWIGVGAQMRQDALALLSS